LTGNFRIIDGNVISCFHCNTALNLLVASCCSITRRRENNKTEEGKLCIPEHANILNPYACTAPLPTADFFWFYITDAHLLLVQIM
jgi:hypothetical protein